MKNPLSRQDQGVFELHPNLHMRVFLKPFETPGGLSPDGQTPLSFLSPDGDLVEREAPSIP